MDLREGIPDMIIIFYVRLNKTNTRLLKKEWNDLGTILQRCGFFKIEFLMKIAFLELLKLENTFYAEKR